MAKYYGDSCGEINRKSGTLCRGKGTKHAGRPGSEKYRYVCSRHFKQWSADRDQELRELKRDHQIGLHADNKEAFLGTPPISDEYNITLCQDCKDETAAAKYGVKPEQAFKAGMIESRMKKDRTEYEGTLAKMAEAAKDFNGTYWLTNYGDDLIEEEELDNLWQRVTRYMEEGFSESWSAPKTKLNIVEAYEKVVEECKDNLISSTFNGEGSSRAFSRAIGASLRDAAKQFIGRVNY